MEPWEETRIPFDVTRKLWELSGEAEEGLPLIEEIVYSVETVHGVEETHRTRYPYAYNGEIIKSIEQVFGVCTYKRCRRVLTQSSAAYCAHENDLGLICPEHRRMWGNPPSFFCLTHSREEFLKRFMPFALGAAVLAALSIWLVITV